MSFLRPQSGRRELRGPEGCMPLREGTSRSRTGHVGTVALSLSCGGSDPPQDNENRVRKALLVAENTSPSFCSISSMPGGVAEELLANARRHVCSKLRVSSASSTQHTCCACCRGSVTAADSKNSAGFFTDHTCSLSVLSSALDESIDSESTDGCPVKPRAHRLTTLGP